MEEDWLLGGLLDSSAPRVYIITGHSDSLSTRLTHVKWEAVYSWYGQWRLRGQCPSLQHSGQVFSLSWRGHSWPGDGQWMTETIAKSRTGCLLVSCQPPPSPLQVKKSSFNAKCALREWRLAWGTISCHNTSCATPSSSRCFRRLNNFFSFLLLGDSTCLCFIFIYESIPLSYNSFKIF